MAVDVLYDNLGILSMPPQVQQTCDAGLPGQGNNQTATCFWNTNSFLAGGGLPSNQPAPFTDPLAAVRRPLPSFRTSLCPIQRAGTSGCSMCSLRNTPWKFVTWEPKAFTCRSRPV